MIKIDSQSEKKLRKNLVVPNKSSTFAPAFKIKHKGNAPLAQLVEQLTLNQWV